MKPLTPWQQIMIEHALLAKLKQWETADPSTPGIEHLIDLLAQINAGRLVVLRKAGGSNVR